MLPKKNHILWDTEHKQSDSHNYFKLNNPYEVITKACHLFELASIQKDTHTETDKDQEWLECYGYNFSIAKYL